MVRPWWVEARLRHWVWSFVGSVALALLSWRGQGLGVEVPIALRQVSAPEVAVMIAVVFAVHPLLDWLPQIAQGLGRERRLRSLRVAVSAILVGVVSASAVEAVPHVLVFGLALWALTVLTVTIASGELAWVVPLIGGMALFIADGGYSAPISAALAQPPSLPSVGVLVGLAGALYSRFGPRARSRARQ